MSQSSTSLRVGLVGYGDIAAYHARHLTAAGARVVAVVTSRPVPDGLARYESLAGMLPHVDAVTIAVPNHLHAPLCIEAVTAGVPVFVEKPLCVTEQQLHALEAVLLRATRPVHLGMRLRWNPALRELRARVRSVRRVRCAYILGIERLAAAKPWTRIEAESGGAFFTLGVHALDLARWMAAADGRPIEHLRAAQGHTGAGADFPLLARAEGQLADGAAIEAIADLRGDAPFRLEIAVEAGNGLFTEAALTEMPPQDERAAEVEYAGLMTHFVAAASRNASDPDEIADMLQCHRDLLRARATATTSD